MFPETEMQNKRRQLAVSRGRSGGTDVGGTWGAEGSANRGEVLELSQKAILRMRIPSVGAWGVGGGDMAENQLHVGQKWIFLDGEECNFPTVEDELLLM